MRHLFSKPIELSLIVIAYNMDRELPRTLESLAKGYQHGAEAINYEVLVVDAGSNPPFGRKRVESMGDNFRYLFLKHAPSSPAYAMNRGVQESRGSIVCLMIDGARIASPGIVRWAAAAFRAFDDPTVSVLGWHLGPQRQNYSIREGYNQEKEDALLQEINFPRDGYRLFEISVLAGSCEPGWFSPIAESNAVFLHKDAFWEIGGFDERFDSPGGGLVNLDFYRRAVLRDSSELVVLLGEGVFHQIHGGVSTNVSAEQLQSKLDEWSAQYRMIRGEAFERPKKQPTYLGKLPSSALPSVAESARAALEQPDIWDGED